MLIAAVGSHVLEDPRTCRAVMEARTLAAYQPAIATAVQVSERSGTRAARLAHPGRHQGRRMIRWHRSLLQARLITASLDGMMTAPGTRLVLLGHRRRRAERLKQGP
jgi:hypothetical protein